MTRLLLPDFRLPISCLEAKLHLVVSRSAEWVECKFVRDQGEIDALKQQLDAQPLSKLDQIREKMSESIQKLDEVIQLTTASMRVRTVQHEQLCVAMQLYVPPQHEADIAAASGAGPVLPLQ